MSLKARFSNNLICNLLSFHLHNSFWDYHWPLFLFYIVYLSLLHTHKIIINVEQKIFFYFILCNIRLDNTLEILCSTEEETRGVKCGKGIGQLSQKHFFSFSLFPKSVAHWESTEGILYQASKPRQCSKASHETHTQRHAHTRTACIPNESSKFTHLAFQQGMKRGADLDS